jgi:2,3-bisphosphoglycerate-dependent phosphoglycerate mutase
LPLKKIYLVRHGQTKYNQLGIVQGRGIDAPLNETGLAQAEMFYQAYKNIPFEKVYTSLLKRTHESIQAFMSDGIAHEQHAGLDEISWGDHEGAVASAERNTYFKNISAQWRSGHTNIKIEGGESPEDVIARQAVIMNKIIASEEGVILICMHGRAIRILLCHLLNLPLSRMDDFEHHNLGLYILEHSAGNFNVLVENSTGHLQP